MATRKASAMLTNARAHTRCIASTRAWDQALRRGLAPLFCGVALHSAVVWADARQPAVHAITTVPITSTATAPVGAPVVAPNTPSGTSPIAAPAPPNALELPQLPPPELRANPVENATLQRPIDADRTVSQELEALKRLANNPPHTARKNGRAETQAAGRAAWTLGLIHLHGAGAPQNADAAQQWFERAQQLKGPLAPAGLAWCAMDGCRPPPNPSQARRWIARLKPVDAPRALYFEWLLQTRLAPLQTAAPDTLALNTHAADPTHGVLDKAGASGDLHAQIELGLQALSDGDHSAALRWLDAAAPHSEVAAMNAAIVRAHDPSTTQVPSDGSQLAEEWLAQAQRNHRGDGQPANYSEAIRLYRLAAAKGSPEATRMLALIYSRPLVNGGLDVAWIGHLSALDLSRSTPSLRQHTAQRQLRKEITPLIDYLPKKWRERMQ